MNDDEYLASLRWALLTIVHTVAEVSNERRREWRHAHYRQLAVTGTSRERRERRQRQRVEP